MYGLSEATACYRQPARKALEAVGGVRWWVVARGHPQRTHLRRTRQSTCLGSTTLALFRMAARMMAKEGPMVASRGGATAHTAAPCARALGLPSCAARGAAALSARPARLPVIARWPRAAAGIQFGAASTRVSATLGPWRYRRAIQLASSCAGIPTCCRR